MSLLTQHWQWIFLSAAVTYGLRVIPFLIVRISRIRITPGVVRFLNAAGYAVIGSLISESVFQVSGIGNAIAVWQLAGNLLIIVAVFCLMVFSRSPLICLLGGFAAALMLHVEWFGGP